MGEQRHPQAGTSTPAGLSELAGLTQPQEALQTLAELTSRYGLETALAAMERSIHGEHLSSCDAAVLAERIAGFGLDTKPTAGPSLAVYDRAFLRGGPA